ncbi:hypothetical protein PVAND_017141 [Polypedilum vanderplanki]|uniref:Gustatory receptor n=1 Tax=Polypedilum vanderplanki TaxID=319348 RepID=A0A9J6BH87_POLVA|nr:hypothetical protein PVAND_017141 [Polypedilum vanderplanki]
MKSINFITTFRPLYLISIFCGFLFFTINFDNFTAKISPWNFLTLFIVTAVNIAMSFSYWFVTFFFDGFKVEITQKSMPWLICLDHLTQIFAIFWFLKNRGNFVKFLKTIVEIDENLLEFGVKIDHNLRKKKLIKIMIGIFFYIIGFHIYTLFTQSYSIPLMAFSIWIYLVWIISISHFVLAAVTIGQRFEFLNSCIENNFKEIKKCSKIHLKIAESVKTFNKIFGPPMMFFFASLFAFNCVTAFTLIVIPKYDWSKITTLIQISITITFTFFELVITIYAAEKISNAKTKAIEILYKNLNNQNENQAEVMNLVSQISHTNVSLGCKFFDFNSKFLFQVRNFSVCVDEIA